MRSIWAAVGCTTGVADYYRAWLVQLTLDQVKADMKIYATQLNKPPYLKECYGPDRSRWPEGGAIPLLFRGPFAALLV